MMEAAWDIAVIGAGPAGSIAARECARRGARVVLIDKIGFPRWKVCGCCLNAGAAGVLERVGLGSVLSDLNARPIEKLVLVSRRGFHARVPVRDGCSVSRWALDEALANGAADAGCCLRLGSAATVGPVEGDARVVRVGDLDIRARVVIVADGLSGTALRELPEFEPIVASRSLVGIGCVMEGAPWWCERGAVTMVCGRWGYVGSVWLEGKRVDVAAAVDAEWMKRRGGPGLAVGCLLAEAGLAWGELEGAAWRGTSRLTRCRKVEAERLLVIGDAAGYVEPFTGEGMAWAMMTGEAAAGVAVDMARGGAKGRWSEMHRELMGPRQRDCRVIAKILRRPVVSTVAIAAMGAAPGLAAGIVRRINGRGPQAIPA